LFRYTCILNGIEPSIPKVNTADCGKETIPARKTFCELCAANPVKADYLKALMVKEPAMYDTRSFDLYCPPGNGTSSTAPSSPSTFTNCHTFWCGIDGKLMFGHRCKQTGDIGDIGGSIPSKCECNGVSSYLGNPLNPKEQRCTSINGGNTRSANSPVQFYKHVCSGMPQGVVRLYAFVSESDCKSVDWKDVAVEKDPDVKVYVY
jgi:hypothetical protein